MCTGPACTVPPNHCKQEETEWGENRVLQASEGHGTGESFRGCGSSVSMGRWSQGGRHRLVRGSSGVQGLKCIPFICPDSPLCTCFTGASVRQPVGLVWSWGHDCPYCRLFPAGFSSVLAFFAMHSSHFPARPPSWQPHL